MKKVYFFIFITMTLTLFSCNANYAEDDFQKGWQSVDNQTKYH